MNSNDIISCVIFQRRPDARDLSQSLIFYRKGCYNVLIRYIEPLQEKHRKRQLQFLRKRVFSSLFKK